MLASIEIKKPENYIANMFERHKKETAKKKPKTFLFLLTPTTANVN